MAPQNLRLINSLARVLLKPFGTSPPMVMLGLMVVTATFSMFYEQHGDNSNDDGRGFTGYGIP